MTAWVTSLKWFGEHAAVTHPIVDIVSAGKSEDYVSDNLQRLHDLLFLSTRERASLELDSRPDHRPYRFQVERTADGPIAFVGHNPCLSAQKVENLSVSTDEETGDEIVTSDVLGARRVLDLPDAVRVRT
ncbi:MAG: hypothetical protein F4Y02_11280 [Chloroflexi bacterium]|nr:hypothetical protein [Chloroflexota bacterium]